MNQDSKSQKTVIFAIGLPGIGKTTLLRQHIAEQAHCWISPDDIRQELTGDAGDQSRNTEVWQLARELLTQALDSSAPEDRLIVFDATLINRWVRRDIFSIIRWNGRRGQAIRIQVYSFPNDIELAISRQQGRDRQVPESAIRKFAKRYEPFHPETEAAGLDVTHTVIRESEVESA